MEERIFINGQELDINKGVVFPLTYSISDVKNPQKRKRNSSKTIQLPGTRRNNTFFSSAYDLHISDYRGDSVGFDFDPTLRYPCRVTRNGAEIFRGTANLQKVVQESNINTYHVLLYSEITNLFQALGDLTVAELGWSEYDETLSIANIQNSWTAPTGSGIWWPLIDFGFTSDTLEYLTNQLRPYVYIKEIIEKCFEKADLTVNSSFLNSPRIRKLTWGYGGGELITLDPVEENNRKAQYTGDGSDSNVYPISNFSTSGFFTNWIFNYDYFNVYLWNDSSYINMNLVQDNYSQFNESSGEMVCFNDGNVKLAAAVDVQLDYSFTNPGANVQNFQFEVQLRAFKNFALVSTQTLTHQASGPGSTTLNFNLVQDYQVNAGDVLTVDVQVKTFGTTLEGLFVQNNDLNLDVDFNNSISMLYTYFDSLLQDGDTVQVSRFLPKMKAADFVQDMITLFNMYIDDPNEDNEVRMEPLEDFYFETDDTDDWSKKIDKKKPIDISPASNIQGKTYSFKWAMDHDYYKGLYAETYGEEYGDFDYNVPSTFKTGMKKYQLKIAQSVPVQLENTNIIIPRVIKVDEGTLIASPHKGKPRMFFK